MIYSAVGRRFGWSRSDEGLSIFFANRGQAERASSGRGASWAVEAYQKWIDLLETGEAEVAEVPGGIFVMADDAVRLDEEFREQFELPPSWPGWFRLETKGVPNVIGFSAALRLVTFDGREVRKWDLQGPILVVGDEDFYLPTASQYACLKAHRNWKGKETPSEADHLRLLHTLTEAGDAGCRIDLSGTPDIEIDEAGECFVDVVEKADGSLEILPGIAALVAADSADPAQIRKTIADRLHHLDGNTEEAIIRVGKKIVLLDPVQTAQARAIRKRPRISPEQKDAFQKNPAKWLADHVFVHGDVEFLPRVIGIGEWIGGYLGGGGELGESIDWFNKKPDASKAEPTEEGPERNASETEGEAGAEEKPPAEPEGPPVPLAPLVPLIEKNDEELRWGVPHGTNGVEEGLELDLSFDGFPRQPYPHQLDAIQWLGRHTRRAGDYISWRPDAKAWGAGALLADDMGLGKTLSTLLFVGLWYELWRASKAEEPPACLVVAPLSLIENWSEEIEKSFPVERSPFRRIVQAIPAAELRDFYATTNGRDLVDVDSEEFKVQQYGLRFGDGTEDSLDWPGSIVITTYQTLREFRFSFAGCDWGTTIFDEAQNIKNPNALQTIAAKSLKSYFRIALTGTPVENHLGDLWSLMDAVEPGALGSFAEFRTMWIRRFRSNPESMQEVGRQLRDYLGELILRRTKEESLKGLPQKKILPSEIPMSEEQISIYEEILELANRDNDIDDGREQTNHHLACMWELRRITLHPDLIGGGAAERPRNASGSRAYLGRSGKMAWLLEELDAIRELGEKVLIFAVQKRLQEMMVAHLGTIYGLSIPLINGDTKASSRTNSNLTRLGLIKAFCARPDFGICVLSPIAAGAGLNIVAANHVIHLERHWNPAKEDQATDRAYRIGQEKDVVVHLPILIHPRSDLTTFDMGLDRLISQKRALAGSLGLVPVAPVSADDLFSEVFGGVKSASRSSSKKRLHLEDAVKLSWEFFEALVAVIYERESESVILSPRGRDSGADVVVIGHETPGKNLLIQCKWTERDKLDSEHAVREVIGARPIYESRLQRKVSGGIVHTTASRFSSRTQSAAKHGSVTLLGRKWLGAALQRHEITLAQLVDRNRQRVRL